MLKPITFSDCTPHTKIGINQTLPLSFFSLIKRVAGSSDRILSAVQEYGKDVSAMLSDCSEGVLNLLPLSWDNELGIKTFSIGGSNGACISIKEDDRDDINYLLSTEDGGKNRRERLFFLDNGNLDHLSHSIFLHLVFTYYVRLVEFESTTSTS